MSVCIRFAESVGRQLPLPPSKIWPQEIERKNERKGAAPAFQYPLGWADPVFHKKHFRQFDDPSFGYIAPSCQTASAKDNYSCTVLEPRSVPFSFFCSSHIID